MNEYQGHRTHRNILYALVFVLVITQTATLIVVTVNFSKLDAKIDLTKANLTESFEERISDYNEIYRSEFDTLSGSITAQQASFDQQIKLLKASNDDFSAVIDDAVRGVVGVATDKAIGTGFFIKDDGYVVTNYHVISGGTKVYIYTYDKQTLSAAVVGYDAERDVALLKVSGNYDSLKLADSDNLQIGKKVIAIGNPLGLTFSVSEGIISGLDRAGPNGKTEYIQTDVSLNPGNSGGPLIDTSGEVIGINNFKLGNSEGLGFALESNVVEDIINQIAGTEIV